MGLPPNFSFIWKKLVAGSAFPGYGTALTATLAALRDKGIQGIVSLTEEPLDAAPLREFEMAYLHLPIQDFTAPTLQQIQQAMAFINGLVDQGSGVLLHCRAGIGRTGTLLACFLVSRGSDPDRAIQQVRRLRPGSLEVYSQEYCVYQYARTLDASSAASDPTPDKPE
jgi:atypical dual specificity phosphatase